MTRRLLALCAAILTFLSCHVAVAQAQSADDIVWVQIEAHPTLAQATDRARAYANTLQDVNGFSLGGGWYGIALGPYRRGDAVQVLRSYVRDRLIPRDSYLQASGSFRQQFWPVGANVLSTGIVPAPTVTESSQPAAQTEEPAAETPAPPPPPDETVAEARRSERALTAEARKELQVALKWAGFYTAAIDGAFGRGTRNSMAAWQEANTFEVTGVLTTLQRAALLQQYNAVLEGLDLGPVADARAGIEMVMPRAEVALSKVEPPFVHYDASGDIGARVLLISQPGDQTTLFGLYEIMQTLEVVPLEGPRERRASSFTLTGANDQIVSETEVSLRDGEIKGFTLIWPAGDEDRRSRVIAEMRKSFARLYGVLDPAAGGEAEQSIDLLAGLQIRKPRISRSGFFIDTAGTVVTTSEVTGSCDRLTVDGGTEADVLLTDNATGLAIVKPRSALAPLAVARVSPAKPRLQSEVSVAGYSYEGVLSAATLTFGQVADIKGLAGEGNVNRLKMTAQPGDAGGPVFDQNGDVVGMLLSRTQNGRELPEEVAFALDGAVISSAAEEVGATLAPPALTGPIAPRDLRIAAQGMTVLVSCWDS